MERTRTLSKFYSKINNFVPEVMSLKNTRSNQLGGGNGGYWVQVIGGLATKFANNPDLTEENKNKLIMVFAQFANNNNIASDESGDNNPLMVAMLYPFISLTSYDIKLINTAFMNKMDAPTVIVMLFIPDKQGMEEFFKEMGIKQQQQNIYMNLKRSSAFEKLYKSWIV